MTDPSMYCALHPNLLAVGGVCERCGDFMCAACRSPLGPRALCVRCVELLGLRGKARHLPLLGLLLILHGVLLALMALVQAGSMILMVAIDSGEEGVFRGGELLVVIVVLLGSAALHLGPGLLQIAAGWQVRKHRGRVLAFVALGAGLFSFLGCYCLPTSLTLLVWGLIVLVDQGARLAFDRAAR